MSKVIKEVIFEPKDCNTIEISENDPIPSINRPVKDEDESSESIILFDEEGDDDDYIPEERKNRNKLIISSKLYKSDLYSPRKKVKGRRIPDSEKDLSCSICDLRFPSMSEHIYHIRVHHTLLTPCTLCGYEADSFFSLTMHKAQKHKSRRNNSFFCTKCGKGYCSCQVAIDHIAKYHSNMTEGVKIVELKWKNLCERLDEVKLDVFSENSHYITTFSLISDK